MKSITLGVDMEEAVQVEGPDPILSDRAYRHTRETVESMTRALEDYRLRGGADLDPGMRQLVIDGMQAVIDEWREQMSEYEKLKGGMTALSLHSLRELPIVLLKARVAAGLTQKQLAQKLGLKPQQIQRYEATRYRTITLARMLEIAEVLDVRCDAQITVGR